MNYPFSWWANRKSRMGMKPSAKKPPHQPGKEWWTTPPTTCPQPEHIEYAAQFFCELLAGKQGRETQALIAYLSSWMKTAKRLLHEEMQVPHRQDLSTTEGLLMASLASLFRMRTRIWELTGESVPNESEDGEVFAALRGRVAKIRREWVLKSAVFAHRTESVKP